MTRIVTRSAKRLNDVLARLCGLRITRDYTRGDRFGVNIALKTLAEVEASFGRRLSRQHKAMADEEAIRRFGRVEYAPWLYVYTVIHGDFKRGWIPDNFYGSIVHLLNKDLGRTTDCKTLSEKILRSGALPDLAYVIDGRLYDRQYKPIGVDTLRQMVQGVHDTVFVKADRSYGGGSSIRILTPDEFSSDTFARIDDAVIQSPIRQHRFFEQFVSGSVATIRITTVKDADGKISARASWLRLGRSDTRWVRADRSIRIGVTDAIGTLADVGYSETWERYSEHPDTHVPFAARAIPEYQRAVDFCVALHQGVPQFGIIGWDVITTQDDQIALIEWNGGYPSIVFSEATRGPAFADLDWHRTPPP